MKISLTKEKVQYIFIVLTIAIVAVIVGILGYLYYKDYKKWQGYRNDPDKKTFVESVEKAKDLVKKEKSSENYIELGNGYYNLGEYTLAEQSFSQALKLEESLVAYNNLANVYKSEHKYKKAEEMYLKIMEETPTVVSTYVRLHELYKLSWGRKAHDPVSILEKGLEIKKDSIELLTVLASYYRDTGDKGKSLIYFQKALIIEPDNQTIKKEIHLLQK